MPQEMVWARQDCAQKERSRPARSDASVEARYFAVQAKAEVVEKPGAEVRSSQAPGQAVEPRDIDCWLLECASVRVLPGSAVQITESVRFRARVSVVHTEDRLCRPPRGGCRIQP